MAREDIMRGLFLGRTYILEAYRGWWSTGYAILVGGK